MPGPEESLGLNSIQILMNNTTLYLLGSQQRLQIQGQVLNLLSSSRGSIMSGNFDGGILSC